MMKNKDNSLREMVESKIASSLTSDFRYKYKSFYLEEPEFICQVNCFSTKFQNEYFLNVSFVLNNIGPFIKRPTMNIYHLSKQFKYKDRSFVRVDLENISKLNFDVIIKENVFDYIDILFDKMTFKKLLHARILKDLTIYDSNFFINVHKYLDVELPPKWRE